ncbi:hypothetical protein VTK26DRAFT_7307 [Humicola hyalothermophila]
MFVFKVLSHAHSFNALWYDVGFRRRDLYMSVVNAGAVLNEEQKPVLRGNGLFGFCQFQRGMKSKMKTAWKRGEDVEASVSRTWNGSLGELAFCGWALFPHLYVRLDAAVSTSPNTSRLNAANLVGILSSSVPLGRTNVLHNLTPIAHGGKS